MADFFDEEAIVSEGSDDEEVRHELQKHKKSKHLKRNVESDEEEEEEEEDGKSWQSTVNMITLALSRWGD